MPLETEQQILDFINNLEEFKEKVHFLIKEKTGKRVRRDEMFISAFEDMIFVYWQEFNEHGGIIEQNISFKCLDLLKK